MFFLRLDFSGPRGMQTLGQPLKSWYTGELSTTKKTTHATVPTRRKDLACRGLRRGASDCRSALGPRCGVVYTMQPGTAVRVKFSTDYFDGAGPQDEWFQGIVARKTRDGFVFEWQETVCVLTGCFAAVLGAVLCV